MKGIWLAIVVLLAAAGGPGYARQPGVGEAVQDTAAVQQHATQRLPKVDELKYAQQSEKSPERTDFSVPSVTVQMLKVNGRPAVSAMIDGKGPYKLGIETGGAVSSVSQRVVEELNLATFGEVQIGPNRSVPLAYLDSISIGGVTYRGLTVLVGAASDRDIDGFIGSNAWAEHLLTLDYAANKVGFRRGNVANDAAGVLRFTHDPHGLLMISVTVTGRDFQAAVDTRGAGWINLPESEMSKFHFAAGSPGASARGTGPSTGAHAMQLRRVEGDARLGPYVIQRPVVAFSGFPIPIIGSRLLESFTVTLDMKNSLIQFSRAGNAAVTIPPQPWETSKK